MKAAIISGTSVTRSDAFAEWTHRKVATVYGEVLVKVKGGLVALNRHGFEAGLPPHKINHRANVQALCEMGVESVVTLSSVGSVDPGLLPGTLVSCADYMSFAPSTFVDNAMSAFAPVVGNPLLEAMRERAGVEIHPNKVYLQTRGPRFETRAEVRAIRALGADVVGMTFAGEADLILERGLDLTSFAMVDNFAHGVGSDSLSATEFEKLVAKNQGIVDDFLRDLIDYLLE